MTNLIKRGLTGTLFVVAIMGSITLHPIAFLCLFALITGLTIWEFGRLIQPYIPADNLVHIVNVLLGVYLFIASFLFVNRIMDITVYLTYIALIMVTIIAELYKKEDNPIYTWAHTMLTQIYCAGTFSLLNFIGTEEVFDPPFNYNPTFIIALFIFIWLNDTGAYIVGSLIGKRKLFKRISPKKSWEGFFGGLVTTIIGSQIFALYAPQVGWYHWLALSIIIVVVGTWGDLVESLMKRTVQVKDSGNLLPGHGGMLDRFDSVILAIPAMFIYIFLVIRN